MFILPKELSFKHCLQLRLWVLPQIDKMDEQAVEKIMHLMAQQKVGQRPGKIGPRAVKRRPKTYPLLMIFREDARRNVEKNGHPEKLK